MRPTIDAFIVCWNEERIIRHTLRHYSSFCTNITLIDNYSSDNTVAYAKQYFPDVKIEMFDTNNEHRDDILLDVKNNCWKSSKADYVIVCDTDEFLYAEDMDKQLNLLYENKVTLPVVIGYSMGSLEFPENYDIPIYEQVKTGARDVDYDKQIIFSPKMVTDINWEIGAHISHPVFKQDRLVDTVVEFKMLHFKYMSKDYLYQRHEAYAKRMSKANLINGWGLAYLDGKEYVDKCFSVIDRHLYKVV